MGMVFGWMAFYIAPLAPTVLATNVISYLFYLLLLVDVLPKIFIGLNLADALYSAGFMGNSSVLGRLRGAFIFWCVVSFIFKFHGVGISLWLNDPDKFIAGVVAVLGAMVFHFTSLPSIEVRGGGRVEIRKKDDLALKQVPTDSMRGSRAAVTHYEDWIGGL